MEKTWLGTDSGFRKGSWKNTRSKRVISGYYRYNWSSDCFTIVFDKGQLRSGSRRTFTSYDDVPNTGNWEKVCLRNA